MVKLKQICLIAIPIVLLLLIGIIVNDQYSIFAGKYDLEFLYLYLKYAGIGVVFAVIAYFIPLEKLKNKGGRWGLIFIGVTLLLNVLPEKLPFISTVLGDKYLDIFTIRFRISVISTLILLFAFILIQHKLPANYIKNYAVVCGTSFLFIFFIAVISNAGNAFIATFIFSMLLFVKNKNVVWKFKGITIVYVVLLIMLLFCEFAGHIKDLTIWLNPYTYPSGKGYMTVQNFEIMKTANLIGNSSYTGDYSDEVLPTILILMGWLAFFFVVGLLTFLIIRMLLLAKKINNEFLRTNAFAIAIYFAVKIFFNILVFFNLLPFFSVGHLPFLGSDSEIALDLMLAGHYFRCCKQGNKIQENPQKNEEKVECTTRDDCESGQKRTSMMRRLFECLNFLL